MNITIIILTPRPWKIWVSVQAQCELYTKKRNYKYYSKANKPSEDKVWSKERTLRGCELLSLHKYHIPSLIINFWLYNPPSPIYRSIYLFKQKIYPVIIPPPLECKSPPACIEIWIRLFTTFWSLKMWSNSKKYYGYMLLSELLCDLFYNTFFSPRWPHFEGNGHNMCSFLSYKKITYPGH